MGRCYKLRGQYLLLFFWFEANTDFFFLKNEVLFWYPRNFHHYHFKVTIKMTTLLFPHSFTNIHFLWLVTFILSTNQYWNAFYDLQHRVWCLCVQHLHSMCIHTHVHAHTHMYVYVYFIRAGNDVIALLLKRIKLVRQYSCI